MIAWVALRAAGTWLVFAGLMGVAYLVRRRS